jgi:hypothetical protein
LVGRGGALSAAPAPIGIWRVRLRRPGTWVRGGGRERVQRRAGDRHCNALAEGETRWGANPVIAYWGMVIAVVCISQAMIGIWLDHRYDARIWRSLLWLPLFPLVYWLLLSAAAVRGTLPGALRRPTGPVTWHVPRTRQVD